MRTDRCPDPQDHLFRQPARSAAQPRRAEIVDLWDDTLARLDTLETTYNVLAPADCTTTEPITLSGEQTIDGVATSASRVLVKDQTDARENGVYVSASGAWTRATDADSQSELANVRIRVASGTVNAGTQWTVSGEPVPDTDAIRFERVDVDDRSLMAGAAPYASRAVAEGEYVPADIERILVTAPDGRTLAYIRDPGGTALTTADGATWSPDGDVYPDHWSENAAPGTTDMTAAIKASIAHVKAAGGGVVHLASVGHLVSDTILIEGNVLLRGEGGGWKNDYIDGQLLLFGCWMTVAPGMNKDVVVIRDDISTLVGSSYPRAFGGVRGFVVHGNRDSRYAPGVGYTANNNAGCGVSMQGVSYAICRDMGIIRCAEHGIEAVSYDYGDGNGPRSCNNLIVMDNVSVQNEGKGYDLYGGDSIFENLVGGHNGSHGAALGMGPLTGGRFWNNAGAGVVLSGNIGVRLGNVISYDNEKQGVYVFNGGNHHIGSGVTVYDNGRGASGVASEQAGIVIGSSVSSVVIDGATVFDNGAGTQLRGIYTAASGPRIVLGSNDIHSHATADVDIADWSTVYMHGVAGGGSASHPGFHATGPIALDGNDLRQIGLQTYAAWQYVGSISSGTINATSSLVTLDVPGGGTVTAITSSSYGLPDVVIRNINTAAITIAHDPAKLRLNSGADVVLGEHQSIRLVHVSGTVWQEV